MFKAQKDLIKNTSESKKDKIVVAVSIVAAAGVGYLAWKKFGNNISVSLPEVTESA
jgi:diphthamide biosynthesis methyltransferase